MPYLIFSKGLDYNDEIYSVGGEGAYVEKNGFSTIKKAREAVKEKYVEMMKPSLYGKADYSHRVGEFSYDGDEGGWQLMERLGIDDDEKYVGPHYHELIKQAELHDVDWLPYMPQLFEIVEVNFDD